MFIRNAMAAQEHTEIDSICHYTAKLQLEKIIHTRLHSTVFVRMQLNIDAFYAVDILPMWGLKWASDGMRVFFVFFVFASYSSNVSYTETTESGEFHMLPFQCKHCIPGTGEASVLYIPFLNGGPGKPSVMLWHRWTIKYLKARYVMIVRKLYQIFMLQRIDMSTMQIFWYDVKQLLEQKSWWYCLNWYFLHIST